MNYRKSLVLFDKDLLFHPYSHAITLTACSHVTSPSLYCSSRYQMTKILIAVLLVLLLVVLLVVLLVLFVSEFVSGFVSAFVSGRAFLTMPILRGIVVN